jgi:hypothetical protein
MVPKRTEYKGIVFDSKAEAVFARTLDIGGHDWVYHPLPHCGHEWDFLVFPTHTVAAHGNLRVGGQHYRSKKTVSHPRSKPMLVEYKPSMPTNTYVDNLTEQMRADPIESIVVWGNPWDGADCSIDGPSECCYRIYPIFSSHAKYGWGDFIRLGDNGGDYPTSWRHPTWPILGITEYMAQEAKGFRFDLACCHVR